MMKRFALILTWLFFTCHGFGQKKETDGTKEIQQMLATFMDCLTKKDSARFYALFHEEPVVWIGVFKEKTKQALLKKDSTLPTSFNSTYKEFFRGIVTLDACEEKCYNVAIIEDGSIASVSFDYSFWENNKKINWGKEHWGLVKINNRWKITTVLFSMDYEDINPEPKRNLTAK